MVPVPPTCDNGKDIPGEFMDFGGQLIHISRATETFQSNVKYCQSLGGDVYIPETKSEMQQLYTMSSELKYLNHKGLTILIEDWSILKLNRFQISSSLTIQNLGTTRWKVSGRLS